jgi:sulfur carrier protein
MRERDSLAVEIVVNGRPQELPEGLTVAGLIEALEIQGRFAVEVNGEVVPRSRHAHLQLCPRDRVEIVRAIGGG